MSSTVFSLGPIMELTTIFTSGIIECRWVCRLKVIFNGHHRQHSNNSSGTNYPLDVFRRRSGALEHQRFSHSPSLLRAWRRDYVKMPARTSNFWLRILSWGSFYMCLRIALYYNATENGFLRGIVFDEIVILHSNDFKFYYETKLVSWFY